MRYYGKIHTKLSIFCVKSVKIYTGQKKFTRASSWRSWQISGMSLSSPFCLRHSCIFIKCWFMIDWLPKTHRSVPWKIWKNTEGNIQQYIYQVLDLWAKSLGTLKLKSMIKAEDAQTLHFTFQPYPYYICHWEYVLHRQIQIRIKRPGSMFRWFSPQWQIQIQIQRQIQR